VYVCIIEKVINLNKGITIMHFVFILFTTAMLIVGAWTPMAKAAPGRMVTVKQTTSAQEAYDKGFTKQVMREGDEGVKLWNHILIEDDAPGSGTSNKGSFTEPVFGDRVIKKILTIDDPRCEAAHIVFFTVNWGSDKKPPLKVTINGNTTSFSFTTTEQYAYVPVQPSWLRKGDNEITFACPEAKDADSGYTFLIARADEYKAGGGNPELIGLVPREGIDSGINLLLQSREEVRIPSAPPKIIGNHSAISVNGGKSFTITGKGLHQSSLNPSSTSLFGISNLNDMHGTMERDKNGVVGEYTARVNLRKYVSEGTLISPVIDLWVEPDKPAALIPFTEVEKLTLTCKGATPAGSQITWQIRAGLSMDPLSEADWSQWATLAVGASATVQATGRMEMPPSNWDPERSITLPKVRYIQWRAILSTTDPLKSPIVESVSVDREINRRMEVPSKIMIHDYSNPEIRYSSTGFTYQSADEPMNKTVIEREDLAKLAEGAGGEFDIIIRALDYSSRRWIWGSPAVEYPKWNVVDIIERAESVGGGGMCIQFAAYLSHILTVMGFQARHVNIIAHEVVEVWSNDFQKWIYLDPTQGVDIYCYNKDTGIPLSLYDCHKAYYEMYGVKTPIDWMKPPTEWRTLPLDFKRLPISFSTTDPRVELAHPDWGGFYINVEFMRMMPRNDFSTTSLPEPLQQGNIQWPWDGYLNWYDRLAPPKLQYSRHTDREADFWPTLNQVHWEAVPEVNGDMVFIVMTTFTPSFKTFQVRTDDGKWVDSDDHYTWRLHSGNNRIEMRAVSKFGVTGHPSFIECNWVSKYIPKPVTYGSMN